MPVVLLSLAAALAFAVAAVLQQHAAAGEPAEHNLRPQLVLRLARRPLWLIGVASSGVGTLLQLLAPPPCSWPSCSCGVPSRPARSGGLLPALTAFNPLTSVLLGSMLLGEPVRSSPVALFGAAMGLTLVVGGMLALSSSGLFTGGPPAAARPGGAGGLTGASSVVPGPSAALPLTGAEPTWSYDGRREGLDPGRLRQPGTAVSRPPD